MMALAEIRATQSRDIPADLDAALKLPDWRRSAGWPVSVGETTRIGAEQVRRALVFVDRLDDPFLKDASLLALPTILAYGRTIVASALALARAAETGARLLSITPEVAYLQTGEGLLPVRAGQILAPVQVRHEFARRAARTWSWSSLSKLPKALFKPEAVVISHNPLLLAAAEQESRALGFRYAQLTLGRADGPTSSIMGTDQHAAAMAETLSDGSLEEPYRGRARGVMGAMTRAHLAEAAKVMASLRSAALPEEVWSGSGGTYAARAIGLEVLRRGGTVRRFDHGTPRGFVAAPEVSALIELSVSSDFTSATKATARLCRDEGGGNLSRQAARACICGLNGDPIFKRVPLRRKRQEKQARPRVIYAPTQLLGFRQLLPAQPQDTIYLDWQLRVAEALAELHIELICQPHPEGLLRDRPHPLQSVAKTIRGKFDLQLQTGDVFVFDYPSTSALWEAACTDARIVYLDLGAGKMTPSVAELFAKRATIIRVAYDECNRPLLDRRALRDALLAGSAPVDPMPLRNLLAGTV